MAFTGHRAWSLGATRYVDASHDRLEWTGMFLFLTFDHPKRDKRLRMRLKNTTT